jgi:hypothetical protein
MSITLKNPFEYATPDGIPAQDVIDLFVPVFSEYYGIPNVGHSFINGSRGSGKSMMFRYMGPDCQSLVTSKKITELDYFAIHIPIKEGSLDKSDLRLIENKHGDSLLNEHLMTVSFAIRIFDSFSKTSFEHTKTSDKQLVTYFQECFVDQLIQVGWKNNDLKGEITDSSSGIDVFRVIIAELLKIHRQFTANYIRKLIGTINPVPYDGPICTFWDFLFPLICEIKKVNIFPNKPFYLLIDDADNLNLIQTKVLNTWVSLRTTKDISFKISTQLKYKTYRTINDSRIDTPHDYSEINISDIYTSKKGLYRDRVKEAIERRLKKYGYPDVTVEEFFPIDKEQENKISEIFKKYESENNYDFAYRYARPDFMKQLKGNLNTYSYSGFDQLVNISSGVMRHFIDFSSKMFVRQYSKTGTLEFKFIESGIQNEEVRNYSSWFFDENFSNLRDDQDNDTITTERFDKLRNLIQALGQTFNLILFSDVSERRVFSFALIDDPDKELKEILDLGVEYGYFQKSLIGNKMGTGRARLYILSRLLAPHFKLDPSSFAGYKFIKSEVLKQALTQPNTVIGNVKKRGVSTFFDDSQQSLFKDEEL